MIYIFIDRLWITLKLIYFLKKYSLRLTIVLLIFFVRFKIDIACYLGTDLTRQNQIIICISFYNYIRFGNYVVSTFLFSGKEVWNNFSTTRISSTNQEF